MDESGTILQSETVKFLQNFETKYRYYCSTVLLSNESLVPELQNAYSVVVSLLVNWMRTVLSRPYTDATMVFLLLTERIGNTHFGGSTVAFHQQLEISKAGTLL